MTRRRAAFRRKLVSSAAASFRARASTGISRSSNNAGQLFASDVSTPTSSANRRPDIISPAKPISIANANGSSGAPRRGAKPSRNSGHGAESQKSGEPCLKSEESRVSDCDSNPVIEPVREPPAGARARGARDFSDLWRDWPEAERPRNRDVAERLFDRLPPDERRSAMNSLRLFAHYARARTPWR